MVGRINLFERLQDKHPSRFPYGQLRTLQRHVKEWRKIMAKQLVYACVEVDMKTDSEETISV